MGERFRFDADALTRFLNEQGLTESSSRRAFFEALRGPERSGTGIGRRGQSRGRVELNARGFPITGRTRERQKKLLERAEKVDRDIQLKLLELQTPRREEGLREATRIADTGVIAQSKPGFGVGMFKLRASPSVARGIAERIIAGANTGARPISLGRVRKTGSARREQRRQQEQLAGDRRREELNDAIGLFQQQQRLARTAAGAGGGGAPSAASLAGRIPIQDRLSQSQLRQNTGGLGPISLPPQPDETDQERQRAADAFLRAQFPDVF